MTDPYQSHREFERQRDAIAEACEWICLALFVFFLLANAAGAFE